MDPREMEKKRRICIYINGVGIYKEGPDGNDKLG